MWHRPTLPDLRQRWKAGEEHRTRGDHTNVNLVPFLLTAHAAQIPPPGAWRTWMFLGGRGAGKTLSGAEWVRWSAMQGGCRRIALVGPTLHDVREVMIGGPSGLANLKGKTRIRYESSRRRVIFPNGAEAYAFSAEDADSLRGPQFDAAWCDEAAAWPDGMKVWDTLQMALRLGQDPRAVVTTTPRPVPLIQRLARDPMTVITRAGTQANAGHLAPGFLSVLHQMYQGTTLARQELHGELIEDDVHALFRRRDIEAARVMSRPDRFDDLVVAIDPPVTSAPGASLCGLIAAARLGEDYFVLADGSVQGARPTDWAARAVALAHQYGARSLIAEANQGGDMVRETLMSAGANLPVMLVHAHLGKSARAMPVAARYEQGRVHHVGMLAALEDQMCCFGASDKRASPDRVDALVWALTTLIQAGEGPRIRML